MVQKICPHPFSQCSFRTRSPPSVGSRAFGAIWGGCYFGDSRARGGSSVTPLQSTASVHVILFCGHCHRVLVGGNGPGCARGGTLVFTVDDLLCPGQSWWLFLGILPNHLRGFSPIPEQV